ncbi:unnamed protein product [Prunus armeniaca]
MGSFTFGKKESGAGYFSSCTSEGFLVRQLRVWVGVGKLAEILCARAGTRDFYGGLGDYQESWWGLFRLARGLGNRSCWRAWAKTVAVGFGKSGAGTVELGSAGIYPAPWSLDKVRDFLGSLPFDSARNLPFGRCRLELEVLLWFRLSHRWLVFCVLGEKNFEKQGAGLFKLVPGAGT